MSMDDRKERIAHMEKSTQSSKNITRRELLRRTGGAIIGTVGFPYVIGASVLGREGVPSPSNRRTLGGIGMGGQGVWNMQNFLGFQEVQAVAVCDVDQDRLDKAKKIIDDKYGNQDCATYRDFREVISRDDIDMVSLAVPDHWHAITAIMAARAGKDIFAEKPLALTIGQGRRMSEEVKRAGVVWQTGSWQRSKDHFRLACELVRNGRIGKVHTVKVGLPTGKSCEVQPVMPVPEGFDYDTWLGPAPEAPYTEKRCHYDFRWILDYSGGQLTDWAAHHCDIANWAMKTEHTGPISVVGKGEFPEEGLWNAAVHYWIECEFAAGFKMILADGKYFKNGVRFEGTDGALFVSRDGLWTEPEGLKQSAVKPNEIHLEISRNHTGNFLECVRSRRTTITPIEVAHRAITIAHLGNIAMKLGRKLQWDPQCERFVNDEQADKMLDRAGRSPWLL